MYLLINQLLIPNINLITYTTYIYFLTITVFKVCASEVCRRFTSIEHIF